MNRKIKSAINKHSYRLGLEHYEKTRAELIRRAKLMEQEGKPEAFIIKALGLPLNPDNLNAQEATKCP